MKCLQETFIDKLIRLISASGREVFERSQTTALLLNLRFYGRLNLNETYQDFPKKTLLVWPKKTESLFPEIATWMSWPLVEEIQILHECYENMSPI